MNWGTKLVIGLASFMIFIVGMGYFMISASQKDGLVTDNYYEEGLQYDEQTQSEQIVYSDNVVPKIEIKAGQLIIQLANAADYELKLMRASGSQDDFQIQSRTLGDANLILVDLLDKASGKWFLELKWIENQKTYSYKRELTL